LDSLKELKNEWLSTGGKEFSWRSGKSDVELDALFDFQLILNFSDELFSDINNWVTGSSFEEWESDSNANSIMAFCFGRNHSSYLFEVVFGVIQEIINFL
jgi:hypothetical protein